MKTIRIKKEDFVPEWKVGFITLSPELVEEDGEDYLVTYEPLEFDEDFTRTIQHPTEGEQIITIPAGTYLAPFDV
jgi:hypothetical protein